MSSSALEERSALPRLLVVICWFAGVFALGLGFAALALSRFRRFRRCCCCVVALVPLVFGHRVPRYNFPRVFFQSATCSRLLGVATTLSLEAFVSAVWD